MAEALVHEGLRIAGVTICEDGRIILPSHFIVEQLDSHFGVLTVSMSHRVIYYLKPLHEIEELHQSKSNSFAHDAMRAVDLVRKGSSIAFVACAIVGDDAFTRLYVYPRRDVNDMEDALSSTDGMGASVSSCR